MWIRKYLCFVSSRLSLSSGSFEFSSLGSDDGFGRGSGNSRSSSEVFEGFSVSGTSEEDDVFSRRSVDGKLIEGGDQSSSLGDSGSGSFGESEGADSESGDVE